MSRPAEKEAPHSACTGRMLGYRTARLGYIAPGDCLRNCQAATRQHSGSLNPEQSGESLDPRAVSPR